jgi:hypothetical protein
MRQRVFSLRLGNQRLRAIEKIQERISHVIAFALLRTRRAVDIEPQTSPELRRRFHIPPKVRFGKKRRPRRHLLRLNSINPESSARSGAAAQTFGRPANAAG